MPTPESMVQFKAGLQDNFDGIVSKDLNTVYFITDTQRLFVGETEYTRPVQYGSALPSGYLPPNSLFVVEGSGTRDLFFSKDGASWEPIAHINEAVLNAEDKTIGIISAGTYGDSTKTVDFGDTIIIPKVTVDSKGAITAIENSTITLPNAPEDAEITITPATAGGTVVTSVIKTPETTTGVTVGYTTPGGSVTGSATTFVTGVTLGDDLQIDGTTQAADTNVATGTTIPTTEAVRTYVNAQDAATLQDAKDYADGILAANDAMVFKGTVGGASSGATVTDFGALTDYKTGWTYRVIEAGTYAGSDCEVGDLLIAVADYATSFKNSDWTIAQTNIDGAVISSAALASGNIVIGAGGQNVQDSGVSLASLQGTINDKVDKVVGTVGNIMEFGADGAIVDSGVATDSLATAQSVTELEDRVSTNETNITSLRTGKVDKTTTVAGHALSGNVSIELDDLSDVDLTTAAPTNGQSLVFNGTDWVPGAPAAGSVNWANVNGKPTTISIASSNSELTFNADLTAGGAITATGSIKAIEQSKVTGLTAALAGKLDADGKAQTAGTADQVANALTIKLNGTATSPATFNGSAALEVDITPAAIGAQVAGSYMNQYGAGNASELVLSDATGATVTRSGKTIGVATLNATPNANTVATEAAVKAYADNVAAASTLKWGTF